MARFEFNPAAVAPRDKNFELIPAGNYLAIVTETSIAPLKIKPNESESNGDALKLTFELLTDGVKGRKIWVNLNIKHKNAQTEQIAQQQLRELCESCGIAKLDDTDQLKNIPVQVKVKIRKSTNPQYEDNNDISGYASANGASASPAPSFRTPAASSPAAAAPAATGGKPPAPWEKKAA